MNLRNGKIGVVDLLSGESAEDDLAQDIGSGNVYDGLISKHGPESMVIGTGLLTGSLIPASCAGALTVSKKTMPLLGHAGVELKLTGFDFIVLKGKAPDWSYLWVRDGMIELVHMPESPQLNSWQRTDRIRADQGDSKIQVISAGPWCDARSPASQLVISHWGGEDKVGMGAEFGRMNLAAVAFRGMGELEIAEPEDHFEKCVSLMRTHLSKLGPNSGLRSYFEAAGREDFVRLEHRHTGCYGCPYPCRTYLKTEEDPKELRMMSKEPGYLHFDVPALERAFELGLNALDASRILMRCAQSCAEPVAVLNAAGAKKDGLSLASVESVLSSPEGRGPADKGNFEVSFTAQDDYRKCLGLGLCPRYWAKAGFDIEAINTCSEPALGRKL